MNENTYNTIVRTTKLNSDIAEELKAFCKANVHERPAWKAINRKSLKAEP